MNVHFCFVFGRKWNFIFVGIFVYGQKWKMLFGRRIVYITKRSWSWDAKSWSWTLGLVLKNFKVLVLKLRSWPWKKVLITSLHFTSNNTRSSAVYADNRRDAFSGQSRSTNIVPFHILGIVSYCTIVTLSFGRALFYDIQLQKMSWPWNRGQRSLNVIESGNIR